MIRIRQNSPVVNQEFGGFYEEAQSSKRISKGCSGVLVISESYPTEV